MKINDGDHEAIMRLLAPSQVMLMAEVWDVAAFKGTAICDAELVRQFLVAVQQHPNFVIQAQSQADLAQFASASATTPGADATHPNGKTTKKTTKKKRGRRKVRAK